MKRRSQQPAGVFTVAMVADRWGTSDTFVYDLIRAGKLPAFRLGAKLYRIKPEDLENFECRENNGALEACDGNVPTGPATAISASSGLTAMDRTACRLERKIEPPRRPQLVYSGPDAPSPAPARSGT